MDRTKQSRTVVEKLFVDAARRGIGAALMAVAADDLVFTVTGTSPLAGRYEGKSIYRQRVLDALHERLRTPMLPKLLRLIVEDDWVVADFETEGVEGVNGADFSMRYCWILRIRADQIAEITGFYDSITMAKLFAAHDEQAEVR